ncbi:MAG: PLP-dependent aminotransferase family protein [bacterium]
MKNVSIHIDRNSEKPVYRQVYEQLKAKILAGELRANEKLPPLRELAGSLGVNLVTIVSAYRCLEQDELVIKRVGSGTYVAPAAGHYLPGSEEESVIFSEDIRLMGQGQMQVQEGALNFATGTPTADLFPVDDIKSLLNEILDREKGYAFAYQKSQGYYPLRESIHRYLSHGGLNVNIGDIMIVSGAQQGIDILAKAFLRSGDTLVSESPTYTGAISAFRSRGASILTVPIGSDGPDLVGLEEVLSKNRVRLIYVMPNFQNPTGYSYSPAKKLAILRLAERFDALLVEDDCLSDLNFSGQDCTPLKALDQLGRVIYVKSFSKILMPGFRLAFLVVPSAFLNDVLAAKHTADISTSGLTQMVFDLYLRKGLWQKHIVRMKELYHERYLAMLRALRLHLPPEVEFSPPGGGLSFWLALPAGYYADSLYPEAIRRGIAFTPGSAFLPRQQPSRYFRLSIATVAAGEIDSGIRSLGEVIRTYLSGTAAVSPEQTSYTPIV